MIIILMCYNLSKEFECAYIVGHIGKACHECNTDSDFIVKTKKGRLLIKFKMNIMQFFKIMWWFFYLSKRI